MKTLVLKKVFEERNNSFMQQNKNFFILYEMVTKVRRNFEKTKKQF